MKTLKQEESFFEECSYSSSSEDNDYTDDYHHGTTNKRKMFVDPTKRLKASARERKRRHVLNDALERLRCKVPSAGNRSAKLSKIEVLRMAIEYIGMLSYRLNCTPPTPSAAVTTANYYPYHAELHSPPPLQTVYNNNNNSPLTDYHQTEIYHHPHHHQQHQQQNWHAPQQAEIISSLKYR